MLLTTTPDFQGRTIRRYPRVVTGEAIIGANIFRDLFAKVRDIIGGRSGAYESALAADPRCAEAHYNAAGLCERPGRHEAALRHLKSYRDSTQGQET